MMELRWRVGTVLLVAVAAGCSSRPSVYPVQGKVTFHGKPLPGGGAIAFVPLGDQAGKNAGGEIAEDGSYSLTTHTPGDGSMAGEFRVVIRQVTETEPGRTPDGTAPRRATSLPESQRIPALYGDHYQSPLRAKVEANGANAIDFDLPLK